MRRQACTDLIEAFVNGEGVAQGPVTQEERLALRAIRTLGHEAESIGRHGLRRGGALLAHADDIGPMALECKGYFRALATTTHPQETGDV